MGGELKLYSVIGEGTELKVSVPCAIEHVVSATSKSIDNRTEVLVEEVHAGIDVITGQEGKFQSTLLVVEDNVKLRKFIIESFGPGYECHEADNGAAGLKIAEEAVPDLIISDVMMPELDGLAMITALKKNIKINHI